MKRQLAVALALASAAAVTAAVPAQAAPEPVRVLIVGDSVTQGYRGDHTWRYFLWRTLQERQEHVDFVGRRRGTFAVHDDGRWDWDYEGEDAYADPEFDQDHGATWGGRLGAEGNWFHDPIAPQVEQHRPDVIVAMWGVNDLAMAEVGPDELLADQREWVAQARAVDPGVDVLLAELPFTWLYDGEVTEYNDRLPGLAQELSTSTSIVAVAAMGERYVMEEDATDHVHPSVSGQRKIAGMVAATLVPVLEARRQRDMLQAEAALVPEQVVVPTAPEPAPPVLVPLEAMPAAGALVVAPTAPRGVRAQRKARRVVVSWRSVSSAQLYEVRAGTRVVRVSARRAVVRATTKRVRVRAVNTAGASPWRWVRVRS